MTTATEQLTRRIANELGRAPGTFGDALAATVDVLRQHRSAAVPLHVVERLGVSETTAEMLLHHVRLNRVRDVCAELPDRPRADAEAAATRADAESASSEELEAAGTVLDRLARRTGPTDAAGNPATPLMLYEWARNRRRNLVARRRELVEQGRTGEAALMGLQITQAVAEELRRAEELIQHLSETTTTEQED